MAVVGLVLGAVIGVACYKEVEKFQRLYGRGPWNGSPILWGIVGFIFGLFGALFLVIAESNTKKQLKQNVAWTQQSYLQPGPYAQPTPPPAGQWGPPPAPAQWAPPPPPGTMPPGPPRPNVGGSDFLPGRD